MMPEAADELRRHYAVGAQYGSKAAESFISGFINGFTNSVKSRLIDGGFDLGLQVAQQVSDQPLPRVKPRPQQKRLLTPYEVDQKHPGDFCLVHCKLFNFYPERYYDCPIQWQPIATFPAGDFMTWLGFPRLAPYSEQVRALTDGRIYVKGASGEWVQIKNVQHDMDDFLGKAPLKVFNTPRLSHLTDPEYIEFLEQIDHHVQFQLPV